MFESRDFSFFHNMFSSILLPSLYFLIFSLECLVKVMGFSNFFYLFYTNGLGTLGLFHDIPLCKSLVSLKGPFVLIAMHSAERPFLWLLLANSTRAWIWVLNLRFSLHSPRHSLWALGLIYRCRHHTFYPLINFGPQPQWWAWHMLTKGN